MVTLGDQTPTSGIGWRLDLAQTSDVALGGSKVQGVLIWVIFDCSPAFLLLFDRQGKDGFSDVSKKAPRPDETSSKGMRASYSSEETLGSALHQRTPKGGSGGSFGKPSVGGLCATEVSLSHQAHGIFSTV